MGCGYPAPERDAGTAWKGTTSPESLLRSRQAGRMDAWRVRMAGNRTPLTDPSEESYMGVENESARMVEQCRGVPYGPGAGGWSCEAAAERPRGLNGRGSFPSALRTVTPGA